MLVKAPWLECKVLVYEPDTQTSSALVKALSCFGVDCILLDAKNYSQHLQQQIDVAAIFLPAKACADALTNKILNKVDIDRATLPVFFRHPKDQVEESDYQQHHFHYQLEDNGLDQPLQDLLYKRVFPEHFVNQVTLLAEEAITHELVTVEIVNTQAALVTESILYGQVFSLIPIESGWYRGYLIIQTTEQDILDLIAQGKTQLEASQLDFRNVNTLVAESTNMVWGGLKRMYASSGEEKVSFMMQIPLIINHKHKYISFGSTEPHLCLSIQVKEPETGKILRIVQRFVFHLDWQPEHCVEHIPSDDDGEIEFF